MSRRNELWLGLPFSGNQCHYLPIRISKLYNRVSTEILSTVTPITTERLIRGDCWLKMREWRAWPFRSPYFEPAQKENLPLKAAYVHQECALSWDLSFYCDWPFLFTFKRHLYGTVKIRGIFLVERFNSAKVEYTKGHFRSVWQTSVLANSS